MSGWGFSGTFRALSSRLFGDDLAGELDPSMVSPSSSREVCHASVSPSNSGHVRTLRDHQIRPRPTELSAEQLQESMKELMRHPKLWTMYKEELSMQEQPTHPETVRRVLIQFLEYHGDEMTSKPTATTGNPTKLRSTSIFQGWNVALEEESTHVPRNRSTPVVPKNKSESRGKGKSEDLESIMKRLMRHPELWSKYKDLLSKEDSPDDPGTIRRLLVEFWMEHEQQVLRLEKKKPIYRPANEPKLREHDPAQPSFFQAFNTDLNSESQHIQHKHSQNSAIPRLSSVSESQRQSQVDTHRQLRLLRSSPTLYTKYQERLLMDESEEDTPAVDLLSKFLLEHKEELAALDVADQQAKLREAKEASLLNLETATMEEEKTESTIKSTRNNRERLQPDRRQKFMAYRESISSQSMRGLHDAMEALAGEATRGPLPDTKRSVPAVSDKSVKEARPTLLSQSEHPQLSRDRRQKFSGYKDSISSRSLRGIQEAMDSLSGEATMPPTGQIDSSKASKTVNVEGQTPLRNSWQESSSADDGDMNSSIGSLVAWGHAFSFTNVSKFVTHEMETLTSELEDCEPLMKQDLELRPCKGLYLGKGDNNDYKDNNDDDDDGDLMLQQAAEIAARHRRIHASNGGNLESIPDENEEDGLDSKSVSADSGAYSQKSVTPPAHQEPSLVTLTMEPSELRQQTADDQVSPSLEKIGDGSQHDLTDDDSLI